MSYDLVTLYDKLGLDALKDAVSLLLLVVKSKLEGPYLGISDDSGHALQDFRYAGANVPFAPRLFELFTMRLDLVVDLTPVDSHDGRRLRHSSLEILISG